MLSIDYNLLQNNSNYNKVSRTIYFAEDNVEIKSPIHCYYKYHKAPFRAIYVYVLNECTLFNL